MKERIHSIAEVASAMCTPVYRALTADPSSRFANAELAVSWTSVDIALYTMERCRVRFEFQTGTQLDAQLELVDARFRLVEYRMRWREQSKEYEIELAPAEIDELRRLRDLDPSVLKSYIGRLEQGIRWVAQ